MVGVAAVRVEGTAGNVCYLTIEYLRHQFFSIHAFRQGYPSEETAFRIGEGNAFGEIFLHAVIHEGTTFAVEFANRSYVFVQIEHIHVVCRLALAEGGGL